VTFCRQQNVAIKTLPVPAAASEHIGGHPPSPQWHGAIARAITRSAVLPDIRVPPAAAARAPRKGAPTATELRAFTARLEKEARERNGAPGLAGATKIDVGSTHIGATANCQGGASRWRLSG
jgi:hypothetical protein